MSGDELVIDLPLPPARLSPNHNSTRPQSYGALMGLKQARAEYKADCTALVIDAVNRSGWLAPERALLHITFGYRRDRRAEMAIPKTRKPYRADDVDNAIASIKMAVDALTRRSGGGAIVDDSWRHMALGSVEMSDVEGPHVRFRIERLS